jgi:hypothetical protein
MRRLGDHPVTGASLVDLCREGIVLARNELGGGKIFSSRPE